MNLFSAAPFIFQIAFFGAAGTAFVLSHLKFLAARAAAEQSGGVRQRWLEIGRPHLAPAADPKVRALRREAGLQSAFGFLFLAAAMVVPHVFRFLHIGT